jgi:hypothetical protein
VTLSEKNETVIVWSVEQEDEMNFRMVTGDAFQGLVAEPPDAIEAVGL